MHEDTFKASRGWLYLFLQRYSLTLRKKTNSKKASAEEKSPVIAAFHSKFRLFLATGVNPHTKWGRFLPKSRWNFDQIPLSFSCIPEQTSEEIGAERFPPLAPKGP